MQLIYAVNESRGCSKNQKYTIYQANDDTDENNTQNIILTDEDFRGVVHRNPEILHEFGQ